MQLEKDGQAIKSVLEWRQFAPPKGADQWVEGRSAFELANAWCGTGQPRLPAEMSRLFDSAVQTHGLIVEKAFPEHRIPFDKYGGEPRNADLAFIGHADGGRVAVTVEAKADEPYGATVEETAADALERRLANPRSRGVERIVGLVQSLLAPRSAGQPHVGPLRYQLLTAVAGTLAFAQRETATFAVLIVHEFVSDKTRDQLHHRNTLDLDLFLQRLGGVKPESARDGLLLGPFGIPGQPLFESPPPLFIGKVGSNRRGLSA